MNNEGGKNSNSCHQIENGYGLNDYCANNETAEVEAVKFKPNLNISGVREDSNENQEREEMGRIGKTDDECNMEKLEEIKHIKMNEPKIQCQENILTGKTKIGGENKIENLFDNSEEDEYLFGSSDESDTNQKKEKEGEKGNTRRN